jgi:hypothetical protein
MRRRVAAVAAVLVVALAAGGCRHHADGGLVLDGRPRYPDAEGVVVAVNTKRLTLDGGRSYAVSPDLRSFSTYTLRTTPLLGRRNQYVQIGLEGHTVVWLAGVGAVVRAPDRPATVFYIGRLLRATGGRLIFRDGTVLRLAAGVRAPARGTQVRVEIDPDSHMVRAAVVTA